MKYNININQFVLSESNLDIVDAAILDYLYIYCNSKNEKIQEMRIVKNGRWYSWVNYQNIIDQMPLLRINTKSSVSARIKKLESEGFLYLHTDIKMQKAYICFTSKIDELFVSTNGTVRDNERNRSFKRTNNNTKYNNTKIHLAEASSARGKPAKPKREPIIYSPEDLEMKLKEMEKEPGSYLDIIATYIREKPVTIRNSVQLSLVIQRFARIAKQAEGAYTTDEIFSAMDAIKKDNAKRKRKGETEVDWTVETLIKTLIKK